jgi:hypothetical protein
VLSKEGIISGIPTVSGPLFDFTIKASNRLGYDTQTLSLGLEEVSIEGGGTQQNPFKIYTAAQLARMAKYINDGISFYSGKGKVFSIEADIDLSEFQAGSGWIPIGNTKVYPFIGHLEGKYHKIKGLKITATTTNYVGLFGYIKEASLKNIGIENANILINNTIDIYAGLVVGYCENSILFALYSKGIVSAYVTGNSNVYTGGLAGAMESKKIDEIDGSSSINNCYSNVDVTASSPVLPSYSGGIVGHISGLHCDVTRCYSIGSVSSVSEAGGIAGRLNGGKVESCAALNPKLVQMSGSSLLFGRVIGNRDAATLVNNIGFADMINILGSTNWYRIGLTNNDGADISISEIKADGSLGERFRTMDSWTIENGKLPGLFGKPVELPVHLGGVGINNNKLDNSLIVWYQNGLIHISGLLQNEKYAIYTVSGILIYEGIALRETETVRVTSLLSGIYIVKAGNKVVKLIKN